MLFWQKKNTFRPNVKTAWTRPVARKRNFFFGWTESESCSPGQSGRSCGECLNQKWPFMPQNMFSLAHTGLTGLFGALMVGGCVAQAVSRKTPIYFIFILFYLILFSVQYLYRKWSSKIYGYHLLHFCGGLSKGKPLEIMVFQRITSEYITLHYISVLWHLNQIISYQIKSNHINVYTCVHV